MEIERRLLSCIALFIATIYYFFGRAEAATLEAPPPPVAVFEEAAPQVSCTARSAR